MEKEIVMQHFKRDLSPMDKGILYYSIVSAVNDLRLTPRELQLLSFTNLRGSIKAITAKNHFCSLYQTSVPTIHNLIVKLKKKHLLVKTNGKISVNPLLNIDLTKDTLLNIKLYGESKTA